MSEQFELFLDSLVLPPLLAFIIFSILSGSHCATKGVYIYFLGDSITPFYGSGFHLYSADSQMYFSSPDLSPEFQTYIPAC